MGGSAHLAKGDPRVDREEETAGGEVLIKVDVGKGAVGVVERKVEAGGDETEEFIQNCKLVVRHVLEGGGRREGWRSAAGAAGSGSGMRRGGGAGAGAVRARCGEGAVRLGGNGCGWRAMR